MVPAEQAGRRQTELVPRKPRKQLSPLAIDLRRWIGTSPSAGTAAASLHLLLEQPAVRRHWAGDEPAERAEAVIAGLRDVLDGAPATWESTALRILCRLGDHPDVPAAKRWHDANERVRSIDPAEASVNGRAFEDKEGNRLCEWLADRLGSITGHGAVAVDEGRTGVAVAGGNAPRLSNQDVSVGWPSAVIRETPPDGLDPSLWRVQLVRAGVENFRHSLGAVLPYVGEAITPIWFQGMLQRALLDLAHLIADFPAFWTVAHDRLEEGKVQEPRDEEGETDILDTDRDELILAMPYVGVDGRPNVWHLRLHLWSDIPSDVEKIERTLSENAFAGFSAPFFISQLRGSYHQIWIETHFLEWLRTCDPPEHCSPASCRPHAALTQLDAFLNDPFVARGLVALAVEQRH